MPKSVPNTIRLPIVLRELTLTAVSDLSPTLRRITLSGPQLGAFSRDGLDLPAFRSEGPDDHVKILLADPSTGIVALPRQVEGTLDWSNGRPTGRSYTPRGWQAGSDVLHLDFVLHGHGPAGNWAAHAVPGDVLHIAGPKSSLLVPEAADWYLLAGDETALPAIANWLERLPRNARAMAFIQVSQAASRIPLQAPTDARIEWLVDPDLRAETLVDAVRAMDWPQGEGFVWGAAEREAVKLLRHHLIEQRGHDRKALDVVAYWHKGVEDAARDAAREKLHQLTDLLAPHAVRVATTLRLPDLIAGGAVTVPALAAASGASVRGLELLVPVLLEYGVLEGSPDALKLGLIGQMLREDQHDFEHFDLDGVEARIDLAWGGLRQAVMSGGESYSAVFGRGLWDDLAASPALAEQFNDELAEWAQYWTGPVAQFIVVPEGGTVADIGGGKGVLLATVLEQNSTARGLLVDLPTAIESATEEFARRGLEDRVQLLAQSFFEPLPAADVVLLAHVLHNWPDAEARLILKRAADAAGQTGTVYIVERHHDPANGKANAAQSLQMLVLFGGRERTHDELDTLAASVGLQRRSGRAVGQNLFMAGFAAKQG